MIYGGGGGMQGVFGHSLLQNVLIEALKLKFQTKGLVLKLTLPK
jgi:hypothetical protein